MKWRLIERATVERVARVMGRNSAAALALECAAEHDGECRFFQVIDRSGSRIVVERVAQLAEHDEREAQA